MKYRITMLSTMAMTMMMRILNGASRRKSQSILGADNRSVFKASKVMMPRA